MSETDERKPQVEGQGEPGVGGGAAAPDKLLRARQVLLDVLERLEVQAEVEVRDAAEAVACNVQVKTGGALFERSPRGQVLESVQYLVNKIVNREAEGKKRIAVDLGTFRDTTPDPAMEAMARRLGESAVKIGKPLTILPMQSRDRRVVHVVIAEVNGLVTRSEGEGLLRRLIVEPARPAPSAPREPVSGPSED
jgi:spoIIIJ-associated protein